MVLAFQRAIDKEKVHIFPVRAEGVCGIEAKSFETIMAVWANLSGEFHGEKRGLAGQIDGLDETDVTAEQFSQFIYNVVPHSGEAFMNKGLDISRAGNLSLSVIIATARDIEVSAIYAEIPAGIEMVVGEDFIGVAGDFYGFVFADEIRNGFAHIRSCV